MMNFPLLLILPESPIHKSLQFTSGLSCLLQLYPVENPTFPYALYDVVQNIFFFSIYMRIYEQDTCF